MVYIIEIIVSYKKQWLQRP